MFLPQAPVCGIETCLCHPLQGGGSPPIILEKWGNFTALAQLAGDSRECGAIVKDFTVRYKEIVESHAVQGVRER